MLRTNLFLIAFVLIFNACTKSSKNLQPEQILDAYVKVAMNARSLSDKKDLITYTTGEVKKQLEEMTNTQFQKEFLDKKFKLINLRTKDIRKKSEEELNLVYNVTFEKTDNEEVTKITQKKLAFFRKIKEEGWKIEKIKTIKTFLKSDDPLDVKEKLNDSSTQ